MDTISKIETGGVTREIEDTTAREVMHEHSNKEVIDKFSTATDGTLLFNGEEIKGGGGDVTKSYVDEQVSTLQTNFQAGVDSVYDAVVAKGSTPASKSLSDVVAGIGNISGGGIDTSDGTATSTKMLEGIVAYSKDQRIVGTIPNNEHSGTEIQLLENQRVPLMEGTYISQRIYVPALSEIGGIEF